MNGLRRLVSCTKLGRKSLYKTTWTWVGYVLETHMVKPQSVRSIVRRYSLSFLDSIQNFIDIAAWQKPFAPRL